MAICSFLGHAELYDVDIEDRLQAAVDRIVTENDTVEFLLHDHREFYNQCLLAAMRARARNPQKVTITLVCDSMIKCHRIAPLYVADRVFVLPKASYKSKDPTLSFKRLVRWVIQNSTHLIRYVYKEFDSQVNYFLNLASNQPLKIFPVTSEDTRQTIIEFYKNLSDRDRLVFERAAEGLPQNKIAENLNISSSRVSQILHYGFRTIHKDLKRRYYIKRATAGERRVRSCSIFSTGEVTDEILSIYKTLISFLITRCDVAYFYIEYTYSNTLCSVIKEEADRHPHHITVVTDSEEYLEPIEERKDIASAFHPPYDALECIAQLEYDSISKPFVLLSNMIDRSDFCICDLSASNYGDAIEEYISQTKRVVLLDIGKMSDMTAL